MTRAIILAGGLGKRLRSVISGLPKPMATINGKPFLAYQIEQLKSFGISHVVLSIGYLGDLIMDYFKDSYNGIPITYAIEKEQAGTGGGMLLSMEKLGINESFLLMNGDTYFDFNFHLLAQLHEKSEAGITTTLLRAKITERFDRVRITDENRVISFGPEKASFNELANAGAYMIDPMVIKRYYKYRGKEISLEKEIFPSLLRAGESVFGLVGNGDFVDIGVPEDYYLASKMLRN